MSPATALLRSIRAADVAAVLAHAATRPAYEKQQAAYEAFRHALYHPFPTPPMCRTYFPDQMPGLRTGYDDRSELRRRWGWLRVVVGIVAFLLLLPLH